MKYIGIDYGTKRIGVAVSDEEGKIAFPLTTVLAGPKALTEVAELIAKNGTQAVVIGESRTFAQEPNPVMEDIEQFKKDLTEIAGIPVEYEQEFLTSALAARSGGDDSSAAALILQSFLDRHTKTG